MKNTFERALRTFPAVLLTGARQAGKTTFLRQEFAASHRYVSLDRPDIRERALADPVAFLSANPPPVILDEVQHTPSLLPYIKDRVDRNRRPGQWLLSGSQKLSLMQGVSETLAGRVAVLSLDPLSTREVRRRPLPSLEQLLARVFGEEALPDRPDGDTEERVGLADWLLRGGYPEPRLNAEVDRKLWLASYTQTYLERDVRDLLQVADLGSFSRFLTLCAARTGTILNAADIGRDVGVSAPTVKRWLSVLETSQVIHLLPPYHRSFGKRIRKNPKLVLVDPGLATFHLGLHGEEAVLHGPSLGPLVETAVIGEWIKTLRQLGESVPLYYWRSRSGIEVDLVIEHGGRLYGLEVKATATPLPRHADGLARWLSWAGDSARVALACRVPRPVTLGRGIRAVPWHLAW